MSFDFLDLADRTFSGPFCTAEWNAYLLTYGLDEAFEAKELAGCPARFEPLMANTNLDPITATDATLTAADEEIVIQQSPSDIADCWEDGVARMTVSVARDGGVVDHYVEVPAVDPATEDKACVLRRAYWGDLNGDAIRDLTMFLQGTNCTATESREENPHTALGLCAYPAYVFDTALASPPFSYVDNDTLGYACPFDHICDEPTSSPPPKPRGWTFEFSLPFKGETREETKGETPPSSSAGCNAVAGAAFGRPQPSLIDWLVGGIVELFPEIRSARH